MATITPSDVLPTQPSILFTQHSLPIGWYKVATVACLIISCTLCGIGLASLGAHVGWWVAKDFVALSPAGALCLISIGGILGISTCPVFCLKRQQSSSAPSYIRISSKNTPAQCKTYPLPLFANQTALLEHTMNTMTPKTMAIARTQERPGWMYLFTKSIGKTLGVDAYPTLQELQNRVEKYNQQEYILVHLQQDGIPSLI